jgi:hypothetical protein
MLGQVCKLSPAGVKSIHNHFRRFFIEATHFGAGFGFFKTWTAFQFGRKISTEGPNGFHLSGSDGPNTATVGKPENAAR